ncbi:MAG: hypothetical protein IPG55_12510 [Saprospiraceae bacterium]|nr:hypothetical protein [Candidatus Defluviibacterium haderslevense]MBK7244381.1 hypothetical protein [Candidatus Defluviibacterium haderslevense]
MKKFRLLNIIFLTIVCNILLGQNYINLGSLAGYPTNANADRGWADSLRANLPVEKVPEFKVFEFNNYLHNDAMGNVDEAIASAKTASGGQSAYLLIVRINEANEINARFKVILKIPLEPECLTESDLNVKETELESILNKDNFGPEAFSSNLPNALQHLNAYFRFLKYESCYSDKETKKSGSNCNVDIDKLIKSLNLDATHEAWLRNNATLKCEIHTLLMAKGGYTEKNVALAKFAFNYFYDYSNNISIDFKNIVINSGLNQGYWPEFGELSSSYNNAFDKILARGQIALINSSKDFSSIGPITFAALLDAANQIQEIVDEVKTTFNGFASLAFTPKMWPTAGLAFLSWMGTNWYELTPIGDVLDIKNGCNLITTGKYIAGGILVGLGLVSVIPVGKALGIIKDGYKLTFSITEITSNISRIAMELKDVTKSFASDFIKKIDNSTIKFEAHGFDPMTWDGATLEKIKDRLVKVTRVSRIHEIKVSEFLRSKYFGKILEQPQMIVKYNDKGIWKQVVIHPDNIVINNGKILIIDAKHKKAGGFIEIDDGLYNEKVAEKFSYTPNQKIAFPLIASNAEIQIYIKGDPLKWNDALGTNLDNTDDLVQLGIFERKVKIVTNSVAAKTIDEVLSPLLDFNKI